MALNRKLITSALATLAVLATTAAASAAPAIATGNVNVRSGPGTGYAVVDALRRGERVDIQYCRGSWCFVQKRGPDGWVSANYLSSGGGWNGGWDDDYYQPAPPPRPPHWNPRPPRPPHWNPGPPRPYPLPYPTNPGASFCFNGPNGYFCAGS
ncbi:MAG TPA: SH3 domain-containing protein [Devosia sp.]|nr:SH3 domain-containing protein [Devosia sp.]